MIVDNAKEMKLEEFAWKCKEAHCYVRSTEPHSPWSNSTEREIRELKKGAARKLMWSGAPQLLWCFALEYKSYIRSHTAHNIYCLDTHVPRRWPPVRLLTLALSVNLAFGIGSSLGNTASTSLTTPWYSASNWVPALI
jgi:hypothetical protein